MFLCSSGTENSTTTTTTILNTNTLSESQGLFMLQGKNKIKGVSAYKDESVTNHHTSTKQHEIMVFDHECLNNRDSMEWWLGMAISRTQLFPFQTTPKLAQDISTYLFSCFQFNNINNQTSSRKPIIVIVINVYMSRNKEEVQEVADVDVDGGGDSMEENILGTFVREEEPRRRMNRVEAAMKMKRFHGNGSVDDMCSIVWRRLREVVWLRQLLARMCFTKTVCSGDCQKPVNAPFVDHFVRLRYSS
ncbi:unnamed protein product [Camellia sinensis]